MKWRPIAVLFVLGALASSAGAQGNLTPPQILRHDASLTGAGTVPSPAGVRVATGGGLTTNGGTTGVGLGACSTGQVWQSLGATWGCADNASQIAGTLNHLGKMTPDGSHIGDSAVTEAASILTVPEQAAFTHNTGLLADPAINVTGDVAVTGRIASATTGFSYSVNAHASGVAATFDIAALEALGDGTYDAALADRNVYGVQGIADGTRAGSTAHNVINRGVYGSAFGGQTNYSGDFDQGLFRVAGSASFLSTGSFGGAVGMTSHKITALANGAAGDDAAAFGQIAAGVNAAVSGTTGTMAKFIGPNAIGNAWPLDDATTWGVASKFTITEATGAFVASSTGSLGGALNMNSHLIDNVTDPVSAQDAVTLHYLQSSSGVGIANGVIPMGNSGGTGLTASAMTQTAGNVNVTGRITAAAASAGTALSLVVNNPTAGGSSEIQILSNAGTVGSNIISDAAGNLDFVNIISGGIYFDSKGGHNFRNSSFATKMSISDAGAVAITGTLGVSSDVAINTNKFTVAGSTGNTLVAGTLGVAGLATFGAGTDTSAIGSNPVMITNAGNTVMPVRDSTNDIEADLVTVSSGGGGAWVGTGTNHQFWIRTNGTTAIAVDTSQNVTAAANLAVNGNTTIGDANTDTLTMTAKIASHVYYNGTAPTYSCAGATVDTASTDERGRIVTPDTSCVLTFAVAYTTNPPFCTASASTNIPVGVTATVSAATFTMGSKPASMTWHCDGGL